MQAYKFDPSILREYDIRGIVGKTLNVSDAAALGRAFGTVVKRGGGKTVAVGYDGRVSSPEMAKHVIEGLRATGLNVTAVGLGPTPMLYYAVKELPADAGLMVTGSHNPSDYNGFKMLLKSGPVYGEAILNLGKVAASGEFEQGEGTLEKVDISDRYIARLMKDYSGKKTLNVAWDAGNGATGEILRRLVKQLPGTHHVIFDDIDGRFPNHHPDPTVAANLKDLQKLVADHKCDLGIGFDGDGDRIGAVDQNGRIVWGDQLLALYAAEVLKTHPGATIIADVKASQVLFDEVARLGGKPLMWKTGHSLLKAKMAETGSPLAGEMSGHIFFGDKWYGFDDALYCAIRLLSLLANSDKTLAQLIDQLPTAFNTPETRFEVDDARKFAIVDEVKARLQKNKDMKVNDIDGVRVNTPDGWWLLRASNTQNVLVARAEASSEEGLKRLQALLAEQLKESGIDMPAEGSGH
jgi:phosphomannomutase